MSRRLEGRTALVTGAATGMGRATAELFGRHGAKGSSRDAMTKVGRRMAEANCAELASR